ncbi:MAG: hypothetical protein QM703_27690 [Gemmatales bacterium]
MGYYLQAIIGSQATLQKHASDFQHIHVVSLTHNIALIPLINELYDEIGEGGDVDQFYKLSPGIEKWAQWLSIESMVAYIEAEFFGGVGGQGAVAWTAGSRSLGPIHDRDSINQILRLLGVRRTIAKDAFDVVGLGLHRYTEDWVK